MTTSTATMANLKQQFRQAQHDVDIARANLFCQNMKRDQSRIAWTRFMKTYDENSAMGHIQSDFTRKLRAIAEQHLTDTQSMPAMSIMHLEFGLAQKLHKLEQIKGEMEEQQALKR